MLNVFLGGIISCYLLGRVQGDRSLAVAAAGGACGVVDGTVTSCPDGQCCSTYNWCGVTSDHCNDGCQPEFGACDGGGASSNTVSDTPPGMDPCPADHYASCATHIVTEGQYSYMISSGHGMTVNELVEMNGLDSDGSILFPLQLLLVKPCQCVASASSRRLTEQLYDRDSYTDQTQEQRGERRLADAACVASVADTFINIVGALAERNPFGLISGGIGIATSIGDCSATNEEDSFQKAVFEALSDLEEQIVRTYVTDLQSAVWLANKEMRKGGDYEREKEQWTQEKLTETRAQQAVRVSNMKSSLRGYEDRIEVELHSILNSGDIDAYTMKKLMLIIAQGCATVLSIKQEIIDLTRCSSDMLQFQIAVQDYCAIGQPCDPTTARDFTNSRSCRYDGEWSYSLEQRQRAVGGYNLFQPICDAILWNNRLRRENPELIITTC